MALESKMALQHTGRARQCKSRLCRAVAGVGRGASTRAETTFRKATNPRWRNLAIVVSSSLRYALVCIETGTAGLFRVLESMKSQSRATLRARPGDTSDRAFGRFEEHARPVVRRMPVRSTRPASTGADMARTTAASSPDRNLRSSSTHTQFTQAHTHTH